MNRRKAIQKTATLAGASTLTPTLLSLLQSCQQQPQLDWNPVILNTDQARLVSALVEVILPKTSTPGGVELQVDRFIDLIIAKVYPAASQEAMRADMDAFDQKAQDQKGARFADLSTSQQAEFLMAEEQQSPKYNGKIWGTAVGEQAPVGFYRTFKSMALWGYFSSEAIGEKVLNYDPIPGAYLGCVPLEDIGNSWSL